MHILPSWSRPSWCLAGSVALGVAALPAAALAQIRTDGSLGQPAASLAGPRFLIPESLGRLSGNNLFHSFQFFNVHTGESAQFSTSTPGLANVISRVTGGSASQINGPLSLTAASGTPGFYFINPAGVTFGAGASVDVPGAFHVSTANYLQFPDGKFSADPAVASTFSSAAPEAFGFLGATRAPIKVVGGSGLVTAQRQALSVVGGDVEIRDGSVVGKFGGAGELRVVAVGAGPALIPLTGALPAVNGTLQVVGKDSGIRSVTQGGEDADAAAVRVGAGDILIADLGQVSTFTAASGKAADISMTASGGVFVLRGGLVDSSTFSAGDAGAVQVRGSEIVVDGQGVAQAGISSAALPQSSGRAGNVDVTSTGNLSLVHGTINSSTYSSADGGQVTVRARNITVDGMGRTDGITGISSGVMPSSKGNAGKVEVTAQEDLRILNRGSIDSSTYAAGNAGSVQVTAGNILIDGQTSGYAAITSLASSSSTGNGGTVVVTSKADLTLRNGGQLDSSTYSSGNAGGVQVQAGSMTIDGLSSPGLGSAVFGVSTPGASGNAGNIEVNVTGALTLLGIAVIDSSVYSDGDGGSVKVHAGSLLIDGRAIAAGGIRSSTWAPVGRKPGNIDVSVAGNLTILDGGVIDSSTQGGADAGAIKVFADSLLIHGQGDENRLTGIFSSNSFGSTGQGGSIDVTVAGKLTILPRGEIDSTTYSSGNAGSVRVRAGSILIDDQAKTGFLTGIFSEATMSSTGNAGSVDVQAQDLLTVTNGSLIDSSTFSSGNAGSVKVQAGRIVVDGGAYGGAGIASIALPGTTGQAGNVEVTATGDVSLMRGGAIGTNTSGSGNAGTVKVSAATIHVGDGGSSINASARKGSSGQTGSVVVQASERITLSDGGRLAIQNDATVHDPAAVVPGTLIATAPTIAIGQDAKITAQATGNAPASNIEVNFTDRLVLDHGSITTSAKDGNGGAIRIQGGGVVALRHAQITTSVTGLTGNGGDIDIHADALVLDTGFVQANTAADNAAGGDVRIDVKTLLTSGNALLVGGAVPHVFQPGLFGFNVIQAAAPTGVSGSIEISTPALDVSGSLAGLNTQMLAGGELARSPCQPGGRSSLTQVGRGGFAPSARDYLGPERTASAGLATGASAFTLASAMRGTGTGCVR
ncbi:MAG TPA: filamentous hemagglutinin N-terminal domain-containing protein [Burkholderiaceae bacterium]|nr:filamentous hemagglutinin N-terminal domain-containing protein [Burkholderiaceae bacterium]